MLFFFFLITDLCFLIPPVIVQIFNPAVDLAIHIGIPINEAKEEFKTHPVIAETKISFTEILGWCPTGSISTHGEKVPL